MFPSKTKPGKESMIHIYASFYEKEEAGTGKVSELEHRIGRALLARGLQDIYEISVKTFNAGKTEAGTAGAERIEAETAGTEEKDAGTDIKEIDELLGTGENGKPFLKDRPDIHFNISHCSGLVVCAFCEHPVGIDVEQVKPVRESLVKRVLHKDEQQVLRQYGEISDAHVQRLFFRYWTLKESYLKQDGTGLTKEPREICFSVDLNREKSPECLAASEERKSPECLAASEEWKTPECLAESEEWKSPVCLSDPQKVCLQKRILLPQENGAEYILSVCVPKCAENEVRIIQI